MKKSMVIITIFLFACLSVTVFGQTAEKTITPIAEKKAVDTVKKAEKKAEPTLVGEWALNPSKRCTRGSITFKEDGTYSKTEWDPDGVGATVKGQYKLDQTGEPFAIDLCLDKCGGPGSEWTTLFGIFKFQKDGTVLIRTSPDAKRPTAFAEKPDEHTMTLTRVDEKE